jgi:hypothetical protein
MKPIARMNPGLLYPGYAYDTELAECEWQYWESPAGQNWLKWSKALKAHSAARDRRAFKIMKIIGVLGAAILISLACQ